MIGRAYLTLLFSVSAAASSPLSAQPVGGPPSASAQLDVQRLGAVVLRDPRIRQLVGPQARLYFGDPSYDKAAEEAFLNGSSDAPPRLQIDVLAVSATGAARALAGFDGRILAVEAVRPTDVPLQDEDVAAALTIAQRNERLQAILRQGLARFRPARAGEEYPSTAYVAEPLPLRSSDPRDPCSGDRCLELIFRTPEGYLPIRVQVDLTRGTAMPIGPIAEDHR
jgi:hypothetical protein